VEFITPKRAKHIVLLIFVIILISGLFTTLYAHNSKMSDKGIDTQVENRSNNLFKAVECLRIVDNNTFGLNRNITEPLINDDDYDNNNISVDNDTNDTNDTQEPLIAEPVLEYRNLVTVVAYPSAIGDLDSYSYAPYLVTWDMDIVNNIYGTCSYNWKQTFEGEWSVVASGQFNDVDFSGLTGREKVQSGKSGNYFKDISSGIVNVERYYGNGGARVI
jgi:hypothetical protein